MRVLLDVNIIISAVLSAHGIPRRIIEAWRRGLFDVITSDGIISEVREKLLLPRITRRYGITDDVVNATVHLLERRALTVIVSPTAPVVTGDPEDDHVLAVARVTHADALVTGDQGLLALGQHASTPIISPRDFWEMINVTE
jgi:putative PIN family toxin of toxin-antitoxin system